MGTLRSLAKCGVIFLSASAISACGTGKRPFLVLDVCLQDLQGVQDFMTELRIIAKDEEMELDDASRRVARELDEIDGSSRNGIIPQIQVHLSREDDVSFAVTNLGTAEYQVAIGFADYAEPSLTHPFAERIVRRLSERWSVKRMPERQGVGFDSTCDGPAKLEAGPAAGGN